MDLGNKLLELRKKKGLSQEEAAEKLNVSRQTISKWETNQSTPDYDKVLPICNLYEITTNELFGIKDEIINEIADSGSSNNNANKKALGICIGIFTFFIAIAWIMTAVVSLGIDPVLSSAIFLIICGIATFSIVYSCIVYKTPKKVEPQKELYKQVDKIVSISFLIIYLLISFITMAWHITWLIWIIYALVTEIIKLYLSMRGEKNE